MLGELAGAPQALAELLQACSQLGMLVSSRAALRATRGERGLVVQPLPIPDATATSAAEILIASRVRLLFAERAQAIAPGFRSTYPTCQLVSESLLAGAVVVADTRGESWHVLEV